MTLADNLLERLAQWRESGPGPHVLRADLDGAGVALTAERTDALSAALWEMTVTTKDQSPCTAAELTERAVAVAGRVTGLLEPLKVYEVDAGRSVALLRSATPTKRGPDLFYHELTLTGRHSATLRRFKSGPAKRADVPFALTHEATAKVVGDILGEP